MRWSGITWGKDFQESHSLHERYEAFRSNATSSVLPSLIWKFVDFRVGRQRFRSHTQRRNFSTSPLSSWTTPNLHCNPDVSLSYIMTIGLMAQTSLMNCLLWWAGGAIWADLKAELFPSSLWSEKLEMNFIQSENVSFGDVFQPEASHHASLHLDFRFREDETPKKGTRQTD